MTREEAIKEAYGMPVNKKQREALQILIPELKENKDERIRKKIVSIIEQYARICEKEGDPCLELNDCLAYLERQKEPENISATTMIPSCWTEKQKEQKPDSLTIYIYSKEDKEFIQDCANILVANDYATSAERLLSMFEQKPIFRIGDTLKKKGKEYTFTIDKIQGGFYLTKDEHFFPIEEQDTWELVEQKPAEWSEDIIRKAIKEVGLTQHQIDWFKTNVFPPKQEWSEEDEEKLVRLLYSISIGNDSKEMRNWLLLKLKSIRPQPNQKWSEEEKNGMFSDIIIAIRAYYKCEREDLVEYFKSLRPQPHTVSVDNAVKFGSLEYERGVKDGIQSEKSRQWKPSEEQMKVLKRSADYEFFTGKGATLRTLYNDILNYVNHEIH